jgi:hypothetical protein
MPSRTSPLFTSILVVAAGIAVATNLRYSTVPPYVEGLPLIAPETASADLPADRRPPQPSEVVQAIYRAFPSALPVDAVQPLRAVVGDFNGDGSPDLAVPARALDGRLTITNGEWPNWILQNPREAPVPADPRAPVAHAAALKNAPLLAVVHGLGASGWRNPEARQAYLLTGVAASRLTVFPPERLPNLTKRPGSQRTRPRGDLLYDPASRGFLYWTGGRYAWHPA